MAQGRVVRPGALPCVLDIEASGFGRSSYPIMVGCVLPDGRAACMLVRPAPAWTHWDDSAEQVYGIARETLALHGRAPQDVAAVSTAILPGSRCIATAGLTTALGWPRCLK